MKHRRITMFLLALLVTLTAVSSAQDSDPTLVATGVVVSQSPNEVVLQTDGGQKIFLIDPEVLSPKPIVQGDTVTIWFEEREDGFFATKLEVGDHINPGRLPQTASFQPLLALASVIAFAGVFSLSRMRRALAS